MSLGVIGHESQAIPHKRNQVSVFSPGSGTAGKGGVVVFVSSKQSAPGDQDRRGWMPVGVGWIFLIALVIFSDERLEWSRLRKIVYRQLYSNSCELWDGCV